MNYFLIVVGTHPKESGLRETYESCAAALRLFSPKLLLLPPQIVLFQSEKGTRETYDLIPKLLRQDGNLLMVQIYHGWRGSVFLDRRDELEDFFALP